MDNLLDPDRLSSPDRQAAVCPSTRVSPELRLAVAEEGAEPSVVAQKKTSNVEP